MSAAAVTLNPGGFHRKPVPGQRSYNDLQQQHALPPHLQSQSQSQPHAMPDNYSRPRAPSNSTTPSPVHGARAPPPQNQYNSSARFSSASSTMSSTLANNPGVQRMPTNSSLPRRSTSSRSNGTASPTSYVALMRKQKATVWCDRAQHEDPRILAKHRADKMRAAMEVAGGRHHSNRVSTSSSNQGASMGIRSKIRHPGATKAHAYVGGANMSGAGVPIRLSATEVDDEDSEDEHDNRFGRRGGSGRSSTGSATRVSGGYVNSNLAHSNEATASADHSPSDSMGYVADDQTPMPDTDHANQSDYFEGTSPDDAEAEQRFGGVSGLPPSKPRTEQDLKKEEELRRRGSVDDRAMTMTGQRLFVANPDLSD